MIFQVMIGMTFAVGVYFLLANRFQLPYYKTSKAIVSLSKRQKEKTSGLDVWLKGVSSWIAKHLRLNDFKREQLLADLQTAQMNISPEEYKANAIIKALLVGVFAVPTLFLFPLLSPVILFLAVFLYIRENKAVARWIRAKRDRIEFELPRLVFTIEKTLKHNRDVLYMLESYAENAGPEMKNELKITAADMRSGNYEAAVTRLETRVGSSMMSDVCRGLIGILRGDDTAVYWSSLAIKFNDVQRQQLRLQAQQVPKKVKRLSMCLLICFMLIYVVVIMEQIVTSMGILFQ